MTVPIGTIMAYGGSIQSNAVERLERDGWLFCDGKAVSRIKYSELFEVIGSFFGGGDKSTTFNLPDLRGRFLRGVDHGQGRDKDVDNRTASGTGGNTGDKVGSLQEDQANSIHQFTTKAGNDSDARGTAIVPDDGKPSKAIGTAGYRGGWCLLQMSKKGVETRPKNIYVNYIIKAK
ncbi:MAG: hypothetical protein F6J92_09860 [Symploca sp. SIO1A3]|nr:hypothetical protein [Symploca sp. SIO1A3]